MIFTEYGLKKLEKDLGRRPEISGEEIIPGQNYRNELVDPPTSNGRQLMLPLARMDFSLDGMMNEGFFFLWDSNEGTYYVPERMRLPSGRILEIDEMSSLAKKGDLEAQDGDFFFDHHVRRLDTHERERECFYESYLDDDNDFENCRKRYGPTAA